MGSNFSPVPNVVLLYERDKIPQNGYTRSANVTRSRNIPALLPLISKRSRLSIVRCKNISSILIHSPISSTLNMASQLRLSDHRTRMVLHLRLNWILNLLDRRCRPHSILRIVNSVEMHPSSYQMASTSLLR